MNSTPIKPDEDEGQEFNPTTPVMKPGTKTSKTDPNEFLFGEEEIDNDD